MSSVISILFRTFVKLFKNNFALIFYSTFFIKIFNFNIFFMTAVQSAGAGR